MDGTSRQLILDEGGSTSHCGKHALTDVFGWFLQILLACLAFTCLIVKRFCEPPLERRPWLIWFYDTSKQGMGALVIHLANVYLADQFQGDPCTWYIINFLLDSSIGLFIIYVGIRSAQYLARTKNWVNIDFGEYGKPPSVNAWLTQCCLYVALMIIVKVVITLLIQFDFWDSVRNFILSPITNPMIERAFVILVIPFFVNILMFWVTDNFLMRKHTTYAFAKKPEKTIKIRYRNSRKSKEEVDSDELLLSDDDLLGVHESGLQQRILTA